MLTIEEMNTEEAYGEFISKLEADEITDFTPYTHPKLWTIYREQLLKRGICVDACIDVAVRQKEPWVIRVALEHKQGQHRYAELAHSQCFDIRALIARYGYLPDVLIKDPSRVIRQRVVEAHPNYINRLLGAQVYEELRMVMSTYRDMVNPDFDELSELLANPYINKHKRLHTMRDELQNKLDTQHIQLSVFEKTMSPAQLFVAGLNGWKCSVNANQLTSLLTFEERLRNHPNCEAIVDEYIQAQSNISLSALLKRR